MNPEELLQQRSIPKQVGQKLVDICDQVLAENLGGRQPTVEELGELAQTMVSELLSASYLVIRSGQGGAADAEAWIKKTLAMSSAAVRLRGSDALIKIDVAIRDVPNKIAQKPAADPAAGLKREPPALPPCVCQKDAEGRCPSCFERVSASFGKYFGIVHQLLKFQQEAKADSCKACEKEVLDPAMASIMPSIFDVPGETDPARKTQHAQEILAVIFQLASLGGVSEMPLTVAAWKEAAQKYGVEVDTPPS